MIWSQVVGYLSDFLDGMRCCFRNVLKLLLGSPFIVRGYFAHQRTIFDNQQALSKTVVELGGNSLPFGFVGVDQPPRKLLLPYPAAFELIKAKLIGYGDEP